MSIFSDNPLLEDLIMQESEQSYIRYRELTKSKNFDLPCFKICSGNRPGTRYAVFNNYSELLEYDLVLPWVFADCVITHYGNYDNAFDITHWRMN